MYVFKVKRPGIRVAWKRLHPFTLQTNWSRVSDSLWLLHSNARRNSTINTCRKYFSHIIHVNNIIFCTECIRVLSLLTGHFHCQYKYRLSAYSYRQVSLQVLFHVPTRSNILIGTFCMKYILTTEMCSPFNPLNPELNPICYLLALLGAHHFLYVSRIRVKLLTFRLLMSYIYIWSTNSWCF